MLLNVIEFPLLSSFYHSIQFFVQDRVHVLIQKSHKLFNTQLGREMPTFGLG
jgi:hypothetical protein